MTTMTLTKEQLLDKLKRAYMRGMYEHSYQKYRSEHSTIGNYPHIKIPDHIIDDLIQE